MFEYVRGIIIAGTACSMAMIALPRNSSGCGRYCRYLTSLIILAVILSPLRDVSALVTKVKETFDMSFSYSVTEEEQSTANAVIGTSAGMISEYIIETSYEKFGFDRNTTRVKLILDENDTEHVVINEIQIYTDERDRDLLDSAKEYFSKLFDTKVFVFGEL